MYLLAQSFYVQLVELGGGGGDGDRGAYAVNTIHYNKGMFFRQSSREYAPSLISDSAITLIFLVFLSFLFALYPFFPFLLFVFRHLNFPAWAKFIFAYACLMHM